MHICMQYMLKIGFVKYLRVAENESPPLDCLFLYSSSAIMTNSRVAAPSRRLHACCVYVCVYIYIYINIHTYICTYVHTTYSSSVIKTNSRVAAPSRRLHACCVCICIYRRVCVYVYIYIYTYIHAFIPQDQIL